MAGALRPPGQPNQAIARQLVVSLDTVKKHVGHLLGKLGAGNRTEAVARAREFGLRPARRRRVSTIEPSLHRRKNSVAISA